MLVLFIELWKREKLIQLTPKERERERWRDGKEEEEEENRGEIQEGVH